jgi:hypothetical protein
MVYCGIGILEMGVEDNGVEPWGKLVEGGLDGCERGSMISSFFFFFTEIRIKKRKEERRKRRNESGEGCV